MSKIDTKKINSLLESVLHEESKSTYGENVSFHCPKCHHRKRKLEINLKTQRYNCWVCDLKGTKLKSLFKFVKANSSQFKELYNLTDDSISFGNSHIKNSDLEQKLDDYFNEIKGNKIQNTSNLSLPKYSEFLTNGVKSTEIDKKNALNYLFNVRNLSYNDIVRYNIHFTDMNSYDYSNRIIIPSYDKKGILNYYFGRSYYEDTQKHMNSNVKKTDVIIFENLLDFKYPLNIVEGGFDAIKVRINAVPTLGKEIHELLLKKIISHKTPINIMYDYDVFFGEKKYTRKLLNNLEYLLHHDIKVNIIILPKDNDPGDLSFAENQRLINNSYEVLDDSLLMKLKLDL